MKKLLGSLLFGPFLASFPLSAQPPESDPEVQIQTDALQVVVDVVVTDRRNRVVTDLTAEDFAVYENGELQELDQVIFYSAAERTGNLIPGRRPVAEGEDPASEPQFPPPPLGQNLLILLLDYSTTAFENQHLVQEAAIRYVRENLQVSDFAAVFLLGSGLRLLQDFTNDKDLLIEALKVRDISGRSLASVEAPPAGVGDAEMVARNIQELSAAGESRGPESGESGSALLQATIGLRIQRMFFNMRSMVREREARGALLAIQAIAQVTGAVEGRKTLFLFSEGFVIGPHVESALEKTVNMANRANLAVYGIESQGLAGVTLGGSRVPQGELGSVSAESEGNWITGRRKDASGGLSIFDRAKEVGSDARDSSLRYISTATGGFSVRHTNDLHVGMKRIDQDIRGYFLLSYRPRNQALDGTFRSVRVELKKGGHTARHRSGYAALPSGMELLSPEDFQLLTAAQNGELPLELPAHFRAEQFAGPGEERDVLVCLEIPTEGLEFREFESDEGKTHQAEIEVVGVLRDEAGHALMRFGTPMLFNLTPQEMAELQGGGLSFNNKTELLPGTYSFQVLVQDRNSSKAALIERPVRILPAPRELALSSIVLGKSVERAQDQKGLLTADGSTVIPSASRRFANGEHLIYFFEIYFGERKESAKLDFSIRMSGSQTNLDLPSQVISAPADGSKVSVSRYIELSGLPLGTYILTVRAQDAQGKETAQAQTPFSIVQ